MCFVNFLLYSQHPVTVSLVSSAGATCSLGLTLWSQIRLRTVSQSPGAGSVVERLLCQADGVICGFLPRSWVAGAVEDVFLAPVLKGQSRHSILDPACTRSCGLVYHTRHFLVVLDGQTCFENFESPHRESLC